MNKRYELMKPMDERKKIIPFRGERWLGERIARQARREQRSSSALIRLAVLEYLSRTAGKKGGLMAKKKAKKAKATKKAKPTPTVDAGTPTA
jgi:hypothetical protein